MINDTNTPEAPDATEETVTEVTESPLALTVQDLANLRNIIDVASQRGAFKTNEFSVIGDTYTKLNNFINAITPPAQPEEEAVAEETAEEATAPGE